MPFLFRRILETFLASFLCSAFFMALIAVRIVPPTRPANFVAMSLSAVVFLYINIVLLRRHISRIEDHAAYYRVNLFVWGLYTITAISLILTRQGVLLAWGFLPVKFLQAAGVRTIASAGIYCLFLLGCIFFVSREFAKIQEAFRTEQEDLEDLEYGSNL